MLRTFLSAVGMSAALAVAAAAQSIPPLTSTASHVAILDGETGAVLFSQNGEEPMPPASMSKLMTMLMVFERIATGSLRLEDELPVSENAWRRGGFASGSSTMCLEPRQRVRVEDLIRGVIVLSGNDASIVFAEALSSSEEAFADEMNARARELGLTSASFKNATGWPDDGHLVSAVDLGKIARILITEHPELYRIYAESEFDYCKQSPQNRFNRNPLLGRVEGVDGLKTGHTSVSGYGLVASAVRDGQRRIVVFNGMPTLAARAQEGERLLTAAFRDFRMHTVFAPGATVAEIAVPLSSRPAVAVTTLESVRLAYHRRAAREIEMFVETRPGLRAPLAEGAEVGDLVIRTPDGGETRHPVVTAEAVGAMDVFSRALAGLAHLIRGSAASTPAGATATPAEPAGQTDPAAS